MVGTHVHNADLPYSAEGCGWNESSPEWAQPERAVECASSHTAAGSGLCEQLPALVFVNSDLSELESSRFSVEWTNKPACYVTMQTSVQLSWEVGWKGQEDSSNNQPSCQWDQTGCGSHAQAGRLITECSG